MATEFRKEYRNRWPSKRIASEKKILKFLGIKEGSETPIIYEHEDSIEELGGLNLVDSGEAVLVNNGEAVLIDRGEAILIDSEKAKMVSVSKKMTTFSQSSYRGPPAPYTL